MIDCKLNIMNKILKKLSVKMMRINFINVTGKSVFNRIGELEMYISGWSFQFKSKLEFQKFRLCNTNKLQIKKALIRIQTSIHVPKIQINIKTKFLFKEFSIQIHNLLL